MDMSDINKKPDLYLSCDEPTLKFAETLKKEIESRCNLLVALDKDDSWEEGAEDCDFLEHMHRAKFMIVLSTGESNITAWVMDYQETSLSRQQALAQRLNFQRCCKPPTIDFSGSHKEGLTDFMDLLRRNTGYRRFTKPSSNKLWNSITNALFV
eukprot:CAMPEP_0113634456 /NCGR_PEP_ID=MMETSP0017_2-20120614/17944_1 /TAXON_ID=2856 /ORGANISM="Cylindrotheca closterium" /LENGTH=153 /DNA_ID=CAMNT_0000545161 /DNA_START=83 /DNA_END=544 /DNA_ORIENTATION=+ /assembly_acc=CAM_ASM_000147